MAQNLEAQRRLSKRLGKKAFNKLNPDEEFDRRQLLKDEVDARKKANKGKKQPKPIEDRAVGTNIFSPSPLKKKKNNK